MSHAGIDKILQLGLEIKIKLSTSFNCLSSFKTINSFLFNFKYLLMKMGKNASSIPFKDEKFFLISYFFDTYRQL